MLSKDGRDAESGKLSIGEAAANSMLGLISYGLSN
jgi:hypothetical protein